jgi:hypothetical protein
MNKFRLTMMALAIMAFTLFVSTAAQAQATRTWVSGVGDDVNPCSRTAPCKTYAGAISKTAANGEISVLDPGGYGTLTITKSITVDGGTGAGWGSTLAAGTSGFIINDSLAASPNTAIVILRNLSIHGAATGTLGIRFLAGKALHVEGCEIFGFRGSGTGSHAIDVNLTAAATGSQRVVIKGNTIDENSGDGIIVRNTNATGVNAFIEDNIITRGNNGIVCGQNARCLVNRNTITHNAADGISSAASNLGVDLDGNFVATNLAGLRLTAATTRLAGNRIVNNTTGCIFAGGTMVTYGDNKIDGNATNVSGGAIPPPINKQ